MRTLTSITIRYVYTLGVYLQCVRRYEPSWHDPGSRAVVVGQVYSTLGRWLVQPVEPEPHLHTVRDPVSARFLLPAGLENIERAKRASSGSAEADFGRTAIDLWLLRRTDRF